MTNPLPIEKIEKMTNTQRASKAGKARWLDVPPKKRTEYARANGKKLWDKIRNGELAGRKIPKEGENNKNRIYRIWYAMNRRCNQENYTGYSYYGGRGIKCLWKSFEDFRNDMEFSYLEHTKKFGEDNTQIDRINVNGNYEVKNCRWATRKEQSANKQAIDK